MAIGRDVWPIYIDVTHIGIDLEEFTGDDEDEKAGGRGVELKFYGFTLYFALTTGRRLMHEVGRIQPNYSV